MGDVTWDGARRAIVWFGTGGALGAQMWEFRGEKWLPIAAPPTPYPNENRRIAWLPPRQRIVAYTPGVFFVPDETWTWDGVQWTQLSPAHTPGADGGIALALDPSLDRLVMFGGSSAVTWWFDGVDWTDAAPAVSPGPRTAHAMVLDRGRGRVVLFGGRTGSTNLGDTWEWNGTSWQQLAPASAPSPRSLHSLAYDAGRRRTVLHGGHAPGPVNDTWEWDGVTWTLRSPAGTAPSSHFLRFAYDEDLGKAVLFSALPNETHLYGPTAAGTFALFGQGCGGSAGTPTLATEAAQRPYVGTSFHMQLDRLPGSIAFAALGWSNTSWFGSMPLPASLAPFGYPNCALAVQTDAILVLPLVLGAARWTTSIPGNPALVGIAFYAQAMAVDPTGPDGLAMTRGAACVVGGP